jgi:non-homologous end joining protein Ku
LIDLTYHIIECKQTPFDPARFNNSTKSRWAEMMKSKQAGMLLESAPAPRPANVINFMDALRLSTAESVHMRRLDLKRGERHVFPTSNCMSS